MTLQVGITNVPVNERSARAHTRPMVEVNYWNREGDDAYLVMFSVILEAGDAEVLAKKDAGPRHPGAGEPPSRLGDYRGVEMSSLKWGYGTEEERWPALESTYAERGPVSGECITPCVVWPRKLFKLWCRPCPNRRERR